MGFSDLGKKLSKLGQDTKNGVQKVSDSVSISNKISQEKKSLERLFALIGEAVYKENPDSPKEGLEDEWAAVKVAYANIASFTEQLNQLKGIVCCPNCGRPAATGDKFCAKCGIKLSNRPETTGAKMAKDLKEAGQEAGKIAVGAADRTGEAVGGAAAGTKNAFSWLKGKLSRTKNTDGDAPEAQAFPGTVDFREEADGAEKAAPEGSARAEADGREKLGQKAPDAGTQGTKRSGEAAENAPFRQGEAAQDVKERVGVEAPAEESDPEEADQEETVPEETAVE